MSMFFFTPLTDPFVKVYLLQSGKKISKKKTSAKRGDNCPIYNEAMMYSVPANILDVSVPYVYKTNAHITCFKV